METAASIGPSNGRRFPDSVRRGELRLAPNAPVCIANNWAKHPRKCGFKVTIGFEIAADRSSVLVYCQREGGDVMRLNFTKADARRLATELGDAAELDQYGRMSELEEACR